MASCLIGDAPLRRILPVRFEPQGVRAEVELTRPFKTASSLADTDLRNRSCSGRQTGNLTMAMRVIRHHVWIDPPVAAEARRGHHLARSGVRHAGGTGYGVLNGKNVVTNTAAALQGL